MLSSTSTKNDELVTIDTASNYILIVIYISIIRKNKQSKSNYSITNTTLSIETKSQPLNIMFIEILLGVYSLH